MHKKEISEHKKKIKDNNNKVLEINYDRNGKMVMMVKFLADKAIYHIFQDSRLIATEVYSENVHLKEDNFSNSEHTGEIRRSISGDRLI